MKRDWSKKRNITTDIAYIAGIIDGEGCIRLKKANKNGSCYYVILHITNADKKILEFVQMRFGGKIYFQEKSKIGTLIYQYFITCGEAVAVLKTVSNFLISKKEQCELAIKYHNEKENLSSQEKDNIYLEMRKMKRNIYENPELLKEIK